MSSTGQLPELDELRRQVADLSRDLVERDRSLHRQSWHLHAAQAMAHLGSWDWDVESGKVVWSDELHRIFGCPPEPGTVTIETFLGALLQDDRDRVHAAINSALAGTALCDLECRIVRPTGEVRFLHCKGDVIRDGSGRPVRMIGSALDITDLRRTELVLEQREAYFRALIEHSSDIITMLGTDGAIRFESPSIERVLGYEQHELDGRIAFEFVHADDIPQVLERFQLALQRPGEPHSVEFRFRHKDGSWRNLEGIGRTVLDSLGQSQIIVNSRDITERKRAETALRSSHEMLRQALQASNTGLWDWNTETNEVWLSKEWKRQLGYEEAEVADAFESWETRLHPDDHDRAMAFVQSYLADPAGDLQQEFRLLHKDGGYRWIEARAAFVIERDGRRVRLLGSHTDITERKRAEEVLAQRSHQQHVVAEFGQLALRMCKPEAVLEEAAQRIAQTLQTEYCKVLELQPGRNALLLKAGVGWHNGLVGLATVSAGPGSQAGYTLDSGEPVIVEDLRTERRFNGPPLLFDHGVVSGLSVIIPGERQPWGVLGAHTATRRTFTQDDASFVQSMANVLGSFIERTAAEDALQTSQARLLNVLDANPGVVYSSLPTPPYAATYVSDNIRHLLGHTSSEFLEDPDFWADRIHQDDALRMIAVMSQLAEKDAVAHEYRFLHKDGSYRWMHDQLKVIRDEQGRPMELIGFLHDVTDRKRAEQALRESEERFAKAFRASPHPIGITEVATGRCIEVNDACLQLFGFCREEVIGRTTLMLGIWPDLEERARLIKRLQAGEPVRNIELTFKTKSGELRHLLVSSELADLSGTLCLITVGNDITERKRAEETLRLTQFSIDRAVDGVFWVAPDARILSVNEAACRMLEYSREELTTMTVHDIDPNFPPEAWPAHWEELKRKGSMTFESKHWSSTGRALETEVTVNYLRYGGHEYNCAIMRDIGERKRAEAELRHSHTFLRQVIDTDPNFIFAKDREGRFILVNKAVADAYGTTVDNLIGKTDADFNPNRDELEFFRRKDLEVMDSRRERFIPEEKVTDAAGNVRWLQTVKRPLLDETGQAAMVLGASTDITARKRVEEALRRRERDLRVAAEERERISEDLHDGILQSIYAIGLGLEICKPLIAEQSKESAAKLNAKLQQTIGQLNHVLEEVRNFIAGLESHLLDGGDFDTALRAMAQSLAASYAVPCRIAIDTAAAQDLSTEQAYHVMNIAREALSNSFRHGQAGRITLSLKRLSRSVRLSVTDDGVGFNPAAVRDIGHGLANMASRARKIGGKFALQSKPRRGAKVIVDIPKRLADAGN